MGLLRCAPLGSAGHRIHTRGLRRLLHRPVGLRRIMLDVVQCVTLFGPWSVSVRCLWLLPSLKMLRVSPHQFLHPNLHRRRRIHQALAGDRRPLLAVLAPLGGFIVSSPPAVSVLMRWAVGALRSVLVVLALSSVVLVALVAQCPSA